MFVNRGMRLGFVAVLVGIGSAAALAGDYYWPTSGYITATTYYYDDGTYHSGSADIAAPYWRGIGASHYGYAYPSWNSGCGYGVNIYHHYGYSTRYCHMIRWPSVSGGQWVAYNQTLGYVGSTGYAFGSHLHFAIFHWGVRMQIPYLWRYKWVNRGAWCY